MSYFDINDALNFVLMKSQVILMIALTMLIKPLWPVGEYIMNYDYIVNVLCENKDKPELECNGKCYLMQLLAQESEQNEKNPFGDKQLIEISQILTLFPTFILKSYDLAYEAKTAITFLQNLRSLLITFKIVQPPEIA